jgi:hypothetical protein
MNATDLTKLVIGGIEFIEEALYHVRTTLNGLCGELLKSVDLTEDVSIPYWLGSKLRDVNGLRGIYGVLKFQSPLGWGLSCEMVEIR